MKHKYSIKLLSIILKYFDIVDVEKASQYIYSSVSNCVSDTGLLKIEIADIPIVDVLNLNNFTRYNEY